VLGLRKYPLHICVEGCNSVLLAGHNRVLISPVVFVQFFDRQRLFTTIFNPTRLANGEGSTLGTLIFDIELINIRQHS
jgi:hypothetical protein